MLAELEIPPLWENERGAQFANLVVFAGERERTDPHRLRRRLARPGRCVPPRRARRRRRDNGAPGVREQYSSDDAGRYYAAFLLDPDGNNVEAVVREF